MPKEQRRRVRRDHQTDDGAQTPNTAWPWVSIRPVSSTPTPRLNGADRALLDRYVHAFKAYDIDALTHQNATQSMPPYDLWLSGRDDILTWWFGPGIGCRSSVMIPTSSAKGSPAYGQYRPAETGGHEPWALQVIELTDGTITELTFFLNTPTLFPLFGLPPRLDTTPSLPAG